MGRSVMTLGGAEAVTYSEFAPDPDYYSDLYSEDIAEGIIEKDDDFEDYMLRRFERDSEYEWDALVRFYQAQVCEMFPTMEPVEDEWIGQELRVIARNGHAVVTISEYGGIVALCLGANFDRRDYFADPSDYAGLSTQWRRRVATRFATLGDLAKVGTFSNGESVYSEVTK